MFGDIWLTLYTFERKKFDNKIKQYNEEYIY
jgi:hypothetical protein